MRRHLFEPIDIREASRKTSFDSEGEQHYFTPQEASKLLPDIKIQVKQLIERKKMANLLNDELQTYSLIGVKTTSMLEKAAQLEALVEDMKRRISELRDFGVAVTDLEWGLIDFPADRYGEKVMLCWRYGEPEVTFWHRQDEGYNGRKPLKAQLIQP